MTRAKLGISEGVRVRNSITRLYFSWPSFTLNSLKISRQLSDSIFLPSQQIRDSTLLLYPTFYPYIIVSRYTRNKYSSSLCQNSQLKTKSPTSIFRTNTINPSSRQEIPRSDRGSHSRTGNSIIPHWKRTQNGAGARASDSARLSFAYNEGASSSVATLVVSFSSRRIPFVPPKLLLANNIPGLRSRGVVHFCVPATTQQPTTSSPRRRWLAHYLRGREFLVCLLAAGNKMHFFKGLRLQQIALPNPSPSI